MKKSIVLLCLCLASVAATAQSNKVERVPPNDVSKDGAGGQNLYVLYTAKVVNVIPRKGVLIRVSIKCSGDCDGDQYFLIVGHPKQGEFAAGDGFPRINAVRKAVPTPVEIAMPLRGVQTVPVRTYQFRP